MELPCRGRIDEAELELQQLSEEMVVAEPFAVRVQSDEKEIRAREVGNAGVQNLRDPRLRRRARR